VGELRDLSAPSLAAVLSDVEGLLVRSDEPMSRHTPMRTGGPAEVWAVAPTPAIMLAALRATRRHKSRWAVHWPWQDLLVREGGIRGLVVRPGAGFEGLQVEADDRIVLGAATPFAALAGLGSGWWDALSRWPGTPGGLFQDGGQDYLTGMLARARWLRGRGIQEVEIDETQPAPDLPGTALLVDVTLRPGLLIADGFGRLSPLPSGHLFVAPPQPRGVPTTAAQALGDAGLLGTRLQRWRLSTEEPGRVVNLGGGTVKDLLQLLQGAKAQVERHSGQVLDFRLALAGKKTRPTRTTSRRGRR
jgi:UDP-N-acetylmuramate dehydrogenase